MENKTKFIWVVEESNTFDFSDGNTKVNNSIRSYFSSEELAKVHIEFSKACAINNKATEIYANERSAKFKLPNGENWVISSWREVLDGDTMGEA